jgi:hypothetical protein
MPVVVMQNLRGGKHFSHLSIRIPTEIGAELANEAGRQRITVNAMVNRALERYLSFDRLADFDHSVTLERQIFEKMLERVDAEDLERIAREIGPQTVKRDFVFFNIPATLDNLVSKYFEPVGMFSSRFDVNASGESPNVKLVLTHEYGPKWSRFLREYSARVIESTMGARPTIRIENNVVTIDFGSKSSVC